MAAVVSIVEEFRGHRAHRRRVLELIEEGSVEIASQEQALLLFHTMDTWNTIEWIHRNMMQEGEFYIRPRSLHFFRHWVDDVNEMDPRRWKEFYRLTKEQFMTVCELVSPMMQTNPPQGLRMALHYFATGDSFVDLVEHYGIGASTVSKYCDKFTEALCTRMGYFMAWPIDLAEVKAGFEALRGFPNCCGAIDCTHFQIELPRNANAPDYFDKDKNYSIGMQAIVDSCSRFLEIRVGDPGSCNDINILRKSDFFWKAQDNRILNGEAVVRQGQSFREYIIGDSGYLELPWLVIPYPGSQLDEYRRKFNFYLSSTRMPAECAFGRLKGRWRLLRRQVQLERIEEFATQVTACCILHNFILSTGGNLDEFNIDEEQSSRAVPVGRRPNISASAATLRNNLCNYVVDLNQ